MQRAYKVPLILNNKEESLLLKCAGVARFAWNWGVNFHKQNHESGNKYLDFIKLSRYFNSLKSSNFPWIYEYSKCIVEESLKQLHESYTKFFNKKSGPPKFKSKRTAKLSFKLRGSIKATTSHIKLPRIGDLRLLRTNYIPIDIRIISAIVSFSDNRWWVSVNVLEPDKAMKSPKSDRIGVDLGLRFLAVTSDGVVFENPKFLDKFEYRLIHQQRKLAKKQKGSCNREKQRKRIQKIHTKIKNLRRNAQHQMTSCLVKTKPEGIIIEDLCVEGMKARFGRSVSDAGFYEIRRQLEYKSLWNHVDLTVADRLFPSSKLCSNCRNRKTDLLLSDRVYECDCCGLKINRDLNAAINLRNYTHGVWEFQACGEEDLCLKTVHSNKSLQ